MSSKSPSRSESSRIPMYLSGRRLNSKLRWSLLQERGDAFLRVGREGGGRHDLDGVGVGLVLGQVDLGVEGVLAEGLRADAAARGAREELVDGVVELVGRHHA